MLCQISWIQIQRPKNQICFYYKWNSKLKPACSESPWQHSRKSTSSAFSLGIMGHSWPLSLFWFKARIPYQISIFFFFPECAFCPGVDGTKWNVEETTLPRTQLSLGWPMLADFLDCTRGLPAQPFGTSLPSPALVDLTWVGFSSSQPWGVYQFSPVEESLSHLSWCHCPCLAPGRQGGSHSCHIFYL